MIKQLTTLKENDLAYSISPLAQTTQTAQTQQIIPNCKYMISGKNANTEMPTPETPIQKMLSQLQEPQRHKHQSQWHSDRILKYIYAHKQHQHQCRKLHFVLNAKDVINFCLRHVSANKVDRDYLTFAVSMKADKKDVTDLIDVKYFNHVTKSIYESIDDMKAKIKALNVTTNWK